MVELLRGDGWLLVAAADVGERQRRLTYLLDDGRRPSVVIDVADDSPERRAELGEAIATGKRRWDRRPGR